MGAHWESEPAQRFPHEQRYPEYGGAVPGWAHFRHPYVIETKPFFLTSEFVAAGLAIGGIAITAASSDAFGAWRAWILISAVVVGYVISRGIAKSGIRSHADDPRENFDRRGRSSGRVPSRGRLRSTADERSGGGPSSPGSRSGRSRLRSTKDDRDGRR